MTASKVTSEQRKRWMELLPETAGELEVPVDPELRSALSAYSEWELAVVNAARQRHQMSLISND